MMSEAVFATAPDSVAPFALAFTSADAAGVDDAAAGSFAAGASGFLLCVSWQNAAVAPAQKTTQPIVAAKTLGRLPNTYTFGIPVKKVTADHFTVRKQRWYQASCQPDLEKFPADRVPWLIYPKFTQDRYELKALDHNAAKEVTALALNNSPTAPAGKT